MIATPLNESAKAAKPVKKEKFKKAVGKVKQYYEKNKAEAFKQAKDRLNKSKAKKIPTKPPVDVILPEPKPAKETPKANTYKIFGNDVSKEVVNTTGAVLGTLLVGGLIVKAMN